MQNEASLRKRYFFKVIGNLSAFVLGIVTLLFVPRVLGPENFGKFNFITINLRLISDMLLLSIPLAYFNWVSRKSHKRTTDLETGLTFFFYLFIMLLFGLLIYLAVVFKINTIFWPEISVWILKAGFIFTILMMFLQFQTYLSDGKALTVGLEQFRLLQNFLKTGLLFLFFILGMFSLFYYFYLQSLLLACLVLVLFIWLKKKNAYSTLNFCTIIRNKAELKPYLSFSTTYVKPLIILTFFGFIYTYFDRWFLQIIGGSAEQGFFSISDRLGMLAFIFTASMTPILIRELTKAHEDKNNERIVQLFDKIQIFLFIACFLGIFISVQSENIINIIGKEGFQKAIIPVFIMGFFPIHQTFGQFCGAVFLSTNQTGLYSKIGLFIMLISVPVTYFLVAPKTFVIPGLGLGAVGLALKMVLIQIVGTNLQLYFIAKKINISFVRWLHIQIKLIGVIFICAFISSLLGNGFGLSISSFLTDIIKLNIELASVIKLLLAGMIYSLLCFTLVMIVPQFIGLKRNELNQYVQSVRNIFASEG